MTGRVGSKGQVVIPKALLDRLGVTPGDLVKFALDGQAVRIEAVRDAPRLRARFTGLPLTEALEADRRREIS